MTKSTYNEKPPKPVAPTFPKLMKHKNTGSIALFYSKQSSTILVEKGSSPFGSHSSDEDLPVVFRNWEPFYGSVTITSEP